MSIVTPDLFRTIRRQFRLDWQGAHGVPHWTRVRHHGCALAVLTGADERVVELFAVLHDACRHDEYADPEHGPRAAQYARWLNGRCFELEPDALELLVAACSTHTIGRNTESTTVQTCWDADRLDIGRVGLYPDPRFLSTWPARNPAWIAGAYAWSTGGRFPYGGSLLPERVELGA